MCFLFFKNHKLITTVSLGQYGEYRHAQLCQLEHITIQNSYIETQWQCLSPSFQATCTSWSRRMREANCCMLLYNSAQPQASVDHKERGSVHIHVGGNQAKRSNRAKRQRMTTVALSFALGTSKLQSRITTRAEKSSKN